ncbi:MAG TPA: hypothetical protein VEZ50_00255 [Nodosilinea sp.]|jgi:hypothetical protein|nr:hypothetical protein [Nodosilinea sp.]
MKISAVFSLAWRLVALGLGVGLWGWWLAAFSVPWPGFVGVTLLLAYGLGTGWGSVVPLSAAISMVVTLLVVVSGFPPFWDDSAPYKYWAYTVLALWAMSLALTGLLAMVGHLLRPMPGRQGGRLVIWGGLLLSLGVGVRLYQIQWPSWVSWENL